MVRRLVQIQQVEGSIPTLVIFSLGRPSKRSCVEAEERVAAERSVRDALTLLLSYFTRVPYFFEA